MSELSELKKSVVEQAHLRGRHRLDQAKKEHQAEYEQSREELVKELAQLHDVNKSRIRDQYERQIQKINNIQRQSSLASKQNILQELFAGTVQEMKQWSRDEQLTFIKRILNKFAGKPVSIQFGEYTLKQLQAGDFQTIQKNFPSLQINDEPIRREGGFVISEERIDYNYLYSRLVEETKSELNVTVANQIFNEA